ncbi:MAG: ribonuclease P protein component [Ktedonobacteraceae bacterium]
MALKRALRLRKNSDFQRVRQQGRSITSRLLILTWMPTGEIGIRIGFVVSKRIAKHAVIRNYKKRLLSEAIRPSLDELSGGWDVVISARHNILDADLNTITHDITTLLRRAKLLGSVEPHS